MGLELRHALAVVTIARAGSISAAAAGLSVPQPSLTAQLRRIERVAGGELFVRSRTGVTPTPLGERVIPMLVDIVRRSEAVLVEACASGAPVLQLGSLEWTSVGLRRAVERALPDHDVRTSTVTAARALTAVEDGSLSAALVPHTEPRGEPQLRAAATGSTASTVSVEPVWLALAEGRPLAGARTLSAERLRDLRWVLRTPDHWFTPLEAWVLQHLGVEQPAVEHRAGTAAETLAWVAEASAAALVGAGASAPGVVLVPVTSRARIELVVLQREDAVRPEVRDGHVSGLRDHARASATRQPAHRCATSGRQRSHPESQTRVVRLSG